MRTGDDYLASLDDDRAVYINGGRVTDVRSHPAFAGAVETVASLFDIAADPSRGMQVRGSDGAGANASWLIPRSREDLVVRREAITTWSRVSQGFIGRGPDHVANFVAGFAGHADKFDRNGRNLGDNVRSFYDKLQRENLYVSYTILPPQVDRSTTASGWEEQYLQVGVVEATDSGIVVRGSQALGTAAPLSDRLLVSCIKPLAPEDEIYANTFVVPINAPGLKLIARRPYADTAPSTFDYPLSTRFDESDCFAVFDDVFVPWEDVFVFRDPEMCRLQFFDTPAHILGNSQAQIRLITKLKFIIGLAWKVAATNGSLKLPPVQERLGELAALAAVVEGMTLAAEVTAEIDDLGVAVPGRRFLYGVMALQSEIYPRIIHVLRDLSGVGVLQMPSSVADMTNAEIAADIDRYIQSPGVPSTERIKLFRAVWDVVGSEFAGRHQQYEMFYAGAPFIVRGYSFRNYGYDEAVLEAETFLSSYGLPTEPPSGSGSGDLAATAATVPTGGRQ